MNTRRKRMRIAETILLVIGTSCGIACFIHYAVLRDNVSMILSALVLFVQLYWWMFNIRDWLRANEKRKI